MKIQNFSLFVFAIVTTIFAADTTTVDTILNHTKNVVTAVVGLKMGTITTYAVIAVVIKLLISLMKFGPIAKYLDSPNVKPLKPYIAIILGLLSGVTVDLTSGDTTALVANLIMGLIAGLGSIGVHETTKSIRNANGSEKKTEPVAETVSNINADEGGNA